MIQVKQKRNVNLESRNHIMDLQQQDIPPHDPISSRGSLYEEIADILLHLHGTKHHTLPGCLFELGMLLHQVSVYRRRIGTSFTYALRWNEKSHTH